MYTYIKQSISKHFVTFEEPLNPEEYNNIGENWQDYLDNKWVLLSKEQATYHKENPIASVKEVWDMELTPPYVRTLEDAKNEKIQDINDYDTSAMVNGFDIERNGEIVMSSWLTPEERANYRNSIDSAELVGLTELSLYIGEMPVILPVQTAKLMLAQIQLYADQCFIVTKQHIAAVEALETVGEVDAYDISADYPNKLVFTL